MATKEQIQAWKEKIAGYKDVYSGLYPGNRPSDKLVASFCREHGIPYPLHDVDTEDEFDFLN